MSAKTYIFICLEARLLCICAAGYAIPSHITSSGKTKNEQPCRKSDDLWLLDFVIRYRKNYKHGHKSMCLHTHRQTCTCIVNLSLSSQMHPIKTGSFSTFLPPPSPPLIWQSLCNLGLKGLFLKMPWALGSWYFPLITVPHYHHKALSTSLTLLITLFRLPWHILSFADALCKRMSAWAREKERKEQMSKKRETSNTKQLSIMQAKHLHKRNSLDLFPTCAQGPDS